MEQEQKLRQLRSKAEELPRTSGVYLMKDDAGKIVYIGKAKNLQKRVLSYLTGSRDIKTRMLVSKISSVESIVTSNEYEALLLENNLIKKWKPHYNINLKDGKSYPVIRITNEAYPRVIRTRRVIRDGSEYFGPFADVTKVDMYLELIEKLYPLRKCRGPMKSRYAPCLYYHIGRCSAPCAGKISREEYLAIVEKVRQLLKGNTKDLLRSLREQMQAAAAQKRFEEAAELRDAMAAVESSHLPQEVQDFLQPTRDYVACVMRQHIISFSVFHMREGKVTDRQLHRGESFGDEEEALASFLGQYYRDADEFPEIVFVSHGSDTEMLEHLLKDLTGRKISVRNPKQGKHLRIMKMVLENASMDVKRREKAEGNLPALEELQKVLQLPSLPVRIEGFDISQLSGKYPVASMVSFLNGRPKNSEYRKFHVKSLHGRVDDYESLREVTARRYTRLVNEKLPLPDLVLIDGGKGQVQAVREILLALGLKTLPVIGLAKEYDEIHLPDASSPLRLPENSEALKILQAVRDETHRFAVTFHKSLREQDTSFSLLESVPGIGPGRSTKLMTTFGSLENIAEAGAEELSRQTGMPEHTAEHVIEKLNSYFSQR